MENTDKGNKYRELAYWFLVGRNMSAEDGEFWPEWELARFVGGMADAYEAGKATSMPSIPDAVRTARKYTEVNGDFETLEAPREAGYRFNSDSAAKWERASRPFDLPKLRKEVK